MALQAITIQDQRYRDYSKSVDFIQRYIFPGGFLPSITAMSELMTRHTDFVVRNLFDMGPGLRPHPGPLAAAFYPRLAGY
ncbi:S-adenosyl-L-methionine dependent methyltransferase [Klebsiella pneumoniae]|uniref:S-adenosyl-L-methionine dependent methyltransferase n=1 Tax=Klebsiella pneumoniae TaxID=573 RepID=A0A378BAR8_KLEPN|nr:S-adenosyl-L-methionine dependent methyltransferase [Klebsiella pneumoniae]